MKRLLLAALLLTACTTQAPPVPHLTLSGLTVTVHNPARVPLTGDTSRQQGPAVTVDGEHIKPAPGASCTPGKRAKGVRWACSVSDVAPGGTQPLAFVDDGTGLGAVTDANGLGYLGNPLPVPIPLRR